MDLSMLLINMLLIWILIKLGKVLIPLRGGFLVPTASEASMAGALLSFVCCPQLITPTTLLLTLMSLFSVRKSGIYGIIYTKALSYTISLLALSVVSYSYYEMVQSFLTGFIYVTPELVNSVVIALFLFVLYWINLDKVLSSVFDYEYGLSRGINPKLWILLALLVGVVTGITLTFIYGFLLAHVVALASLLIGYFSKNFKEELIAWMLIGAVGAALSVKVSLAYSFAVASFAVLLLWKALGKALSEVWTSFV